MAEMSAQRPLGVPVTVPVMSVSSPLCKMVGERTAEVCDLVSWEPALYETCKANEALETGNASQLSLQKKKKSESSCLTMFFINSVKVVNKK